MDEQESRLTYAAQLTALNAVANVKQLREDMKEHTPHQDMSAPSSLEGAPPAKQARLMASFVSLPKDAHLAIFPFLSKDERLAVSATHKRLVQLYTDQVERIVLDLPEYRNPAKPPSAVTGFLLRQQQLLELGVEDEDLAEAAAAAIVQGTDRTLQKLWISCSTSSASMVEAGLTSILADPRGRFSALEELYVGWAWDQPSLEKFLRVMAQGAAPRLRKLVLGTDPPRAETTLGLLVEALEARADKGCAGLVRLDLQTGPSTGDGPADIQRRLWLALLPTLEYLPVSWDYHGGGPSPIVDALLERGAPCLRELVTTSPRLVRHVSRFPRLESLTLQPLSRDVATALIEAVTEAGPPGVVSSGLTKLDMRLVDGDIGDVLFAVLGQRTAFPKLHELSIVSDVVLEATEERLDRVVLDSQLGEAFAAGAFGPLESLSVGVHLTAQGLTALVQGLVASPCAQSLRELRLGHQPFEGRGLDELREALAAGSFPALSRLVLKENPLGDEWVQLFVSSANWGAPLEFLDLRATGITDVGISAIATALMSGGMGGQLRVLGLGERVNPEDGHITDNAARALARALEQGREYVTQLEYLSLNAPNITRAGVEVLLRAALANCLALKKMDFDFCRLTWTDREELRALRVGSRNNLELMGLEEEDNTEDRELESESEFDSQSDEDEEYDESEDDDLDED